MIIIIIFLAVLGALYRLLGGEQAWGTRRLHIFELIRSTRIRVCTIQWRWIVWLLCQALPTLLSRSHGFQLWLPSNGLLLRWARRLELVAVNWVPQEVLLRRLMVYGGERSVLLLGRHWRTLFYFYVVLRAAFHTCLCRRCWATRGGACGYRLSQVVSQLLRVTLFPCRLACLPKLRQGLAHHLGLTTVTRSERVNTL